MKIRLFAALMIASGAHGAMAQSPQSVQSEPPQQSARQSSEVKTEDRNSSGSRSNLPNTKAPLRSQPRSSVTLRQVERQTGGKVIGAKPVSVQGRQLNQIKVQMPNGRIIIHQQLFDENGRSVETVQKADDDPGLRNRVADH